MMGAWGTGPWENDAACDWLAELGDDGPAAIDSAFEAVLKVGEGECIDSDLGSSAVAAMEILARAKEGVLDGDELLAASGVDVKKLVKAITPNRVKMASKVAQLIVAENSELAELWADADQFDEWKKSVDDIGQRLRN